MASILLADEFISTIIMFLTIFIMIKVNAKVKLYISKNEKPKILDAHTEVKRIIDQPNPCEHLTLIDDLHFILLSKKELEKSKKIEVLSYEGRHFLPVLNWNG